MCCGICRCAMPCHGTLPGPMTCHGTLPGPMPRVQMHLFRQDPCESPQTARGFTCQHLPSPYDPPGAVPSHAHTPPASSHAAPPACGNGQDPSSSFKAASQVRTHAGANVVHAQGPSLCLPCGHCGSQAFRLVPRNPHEHATRNPYDHATRALIVLVFLLGVASPDVTLFRQALRTLDRPASAFDPSALGHRDHEA